MNINQKNTREMGVQASAYSPTGSPPPRESVIVVMDADRRKGNVDALRWALKHLVRPHDTVVVLGVLGDLGKKNNCFPFDMGIRMPGIWEKLELAGGQGEINPQDIEDEIDKKREEYHSRFQPFYKQCKKNEVKLEIKLAAGFCAKNIAVEESKKINSRWIVLDSNLKKSKVYIYGHVDCNVAVMKGKDFATLMPSKASSRHGHVPSTEDDKNDDDEVCHCREEGEEEDVADVKLETAAASSESPCWYPLSWRGGFPRSFSLRELEVITNDFADDENVVIHKSDVSIYQGLLHETPVMIDRYSSGDERFWSMLRVLSRVRHRNIHSLVGYCCTSDYLFVLTDFPCMRNLEYNLRRDDCAKSMSWKVRWSIAQEIGASLRYLHEECADGPVVHLAVSSLSILFRHGWFPTLGNFKNAKCLKDEVPKTSGSAQAGDLNVEKEEYLSADVRGYGVLLLELITGKSACNFPLEAEGKTLTEWALPHVEDCSLEQVMDPRLTESGDDSDNVSIIVNLMARAAFFCINKDSDHRFSMTEVLGVVRGDKLACSKC